MLWNNLKTAFSVATIELNKSLRSTKILIFALFAIFIKYQAVDPLRQIHTDMGGMKLSLTEPFIVCGNSGVILLVLPILYLVMMADFPRQGQEIYFFKIRMNDRIWYMGQILYSLLSAVFVVVVIFLLSSILSCDFISLRTGFSRAVREYYESYPDKDHFLMELIPTNLLNNISAERSFAYTFFMLILYFHFISLVILLFSKIGGKLIGLVTDGFLIIGGTAVCNFESVLRWVFPLAHSITWLHYNQYKSEMAFPLYGSFLYFLILDITLIILILAVPKKDETKVMT